MTNFNVLFGDDSFREMVAEFTSDSDCWGWQENLNDWCIDNDTFGVVEVDNEKKVFPFAAEATFWTMLKLMNKAVHIGQLSEMTNIGVDDINIEDVNKWLNRM